VGGTIRLLEHCTSVGTDLLLAAWTAETRFSIRIVMLHDIKSQGYNNKRNYIRTESNTNIYIYIYIYIYSLLASVITAIIRPMLYKNLGKVGYI